MSGITNYIDRERPVPEGEMSEKRNCWTCLNDQVEDEGYHVCLSLKVGPCPVAEWVEEHVAQRGDGESMPAHDAPPCPGWEPVDEPATVQDSLMVHPSPGWRGNLPICRGPGGTQARRLRALMRGRR